MTFYIMVVSKMSHSYLLISLLSLTSTTYTHKPWEIVQRTVDGICGGGMRCAGAGYHQRWDTLNAPPSYLTMYSCITSQSDFENDPFHCSQSYAGSQIRGNSTKGVCVAMQGNG